MTPAYLNEVGLVKIANLTADDFKKNTEAIEAGKRQAVGTPKVVTWFLPIVTHALKGGVRTIFQLAEKLSLDFNTLNIFVIYSFSGKDFETTDLEVSLHSNFPNLKFLLRKFREGIDRPTDIPASDIAFCSLWTTAYLLAKYNQTKRKFYFAQDFEPLFYQAGAIYCAIEHTYRLGFSVIANTEGVGKRVSTYTDDVTIFTPGIDHSVYYPSADQSPNEAKQVSRVVFYGRPENPRNCFSIGIEVLKELKQSLGPRVEILSVGAEWDPKDFGADGAVKNLGLLKSLKEVADLYRSCDIGLVFMATPHPSYQPLEYMACGCVTATNINEANNWLVNSNNSIIIPPTPKVAASLLMETITSPHRLRNLKKSGIETAKDLSWNSAWKKIINRITG